MKISVFIFIGFVLILSMFTVTTYINYQLSRQVNENSEWLSRSTVVVRQSNRFQRNILNMISGLRGFLLSGERYFLQTYDSASVENDAILEELSELLAGEEMRIKSIDEIRTLNDQWVVNFARPLIDAKLAAGESDSAQAAFRTVYKIKSNNGNEVRLNTSLQNKLRNFINYEYTRREIRRAALDRSIDKTGTISVLLTTTSIVTGLLIAAFLAHRISTRIVHHVTMANTIAKGNYDIRIESKGNDELSRLARSMNHMAQTLADNIALLQRKNQELDQFAHIVSHDLKAPLRGIDNVVTWIEEDHWNELSPKMKEYIHLIKGRLVRGEKLIKGILSYSRVGKEVVARELVDINQVVQEVVEYTPLKNGLTIFAEPGLPVVVTERVPLTQLFSNLIYNAVKYHDKADGWVKVYHKDTGDKFWFYVEDNGPGIGKNYHEKIFGIFQTLNENYSFENTGVGLAIVKKILDDRRQKIEVQSEPGQGCTFAFSWPKN
jgi:signal transduction histidine kinase